jgi:hypothetical protein
MYGERGGEAHPRAIEAEVSQGNGVGGGHERAPRFRPETMIPWSPGEAQVAVTTLAGCANRVHCRVLRSYDRVGNDLPHAGVARPWPTIRTPA